MRYRRSLQEAQRVLLFIGVALAIELFQRLAHRVQSPVVLELAARLPACLRLGRQQLPAEHPAMGMDGVDEIVETRLAPSPQPDSGTGEKLERFHGGIEWPVVMIIPVDQDRFPLAEAGVGELHTVR